MTIESLTPKQAEILNSLELKRNPETAETGFLKEATEADYRNVLKEQMETINSTPVESLWAQNDTRLETLHANEVTEKGELTEDQKDRIKEAHPDWSPEIIEAISSWEEYEIYNNAGLKYAEINGKPCLIRDIDMTQKDEYGRTNKERMEQGLAPLDKNGNPIELHHIGQKPDSPLAELEREEHRGKGNDSVLHDKTKETEIDRAAFQKEKNEHWETRAEDAQKETRI
jgi:hypothetical protein